MKKIFKFVFVFLIIGMESLGNMSAVTAILEENLINRNHWITKEDLMDAITISRLGPGATTANIVAFLGNKIAGFWGGVIATVCYTLMPLVIIVCIAGFLDKIMEYKVIISALRGSLVCIFVMFVKSTIEIGKGILIKKRNVIIFLVSMILTICFNVSGIWVIVFSIIVGIIISNKNSVINMFKS